MLQTNLMEELEWATTGGAKSSEATGRFSKVLRSYHA